ncbi:KpsF/GutQ family sugar-phosphate isomerase [Vaginella massiliensis]|uniref:KpsF/GutQ family sugar-phosphate isomerase n=1 Tax=Vaginella massiliensis TaxID=1816680 RepID=UPI000838400A|nr:KpsF/GutQ family sugar-phosphate isomerase [Vaginella massiliensis]
MKNKNLTLVAQQVFREEIEELNRIADRISDSFEKAVETIFNTKGKLVICGIGKSAHIAQKIVATLNSTGTPTQFLHASEAIHGDLGLLQSEDVALCISNSGNTPEIKYIAPLLKNRASQLIAITGNTQSALAKTADIVLEVAVEKESGRFNLAPTSSTTAQLVMGDALAVALMEIRDFQRTEYATFHPGGALGKRLLWRVENIVDPTKKPSVKIDSSIKDVINSMTSGKLGVTVIEDENQRVLGVITDGDLRRMLMKEQNLDMLIAKDIASLHPKIINKNELATNALELIRKYSIGQLIVIDDQAKYYGILDVHSILAEGIE